MALSSQYSNEGIHESATGQQRVTRFDLKDELAPIKKDVARLEWMIGFTLPAIVAILFMKFRR
jgi:hypothetical protein